MLDLLRRLARRRRPTTAGLVMGRRIEPDPSGFAIRLDLHFDHLGRTYQAAAAPARRFTTASQAQHALEAWPIGSECYLRIDQVDPLAISLVHDAF